MDPVLSKMLWIKSHVSWPQEALSLVEEDNELNITT